MNEESEVHWKEMGAKMVLIVIISIIIHFIMIGQIF